MEQKNFDKMKVGISAENEDAIKQPHIVPKESRKTSFCETNKEFDEVVRKRLVELEIKRNQFEKFETNSNSGIQTPEKNSIDRKFSMPAQFKKQPITFKLSTIDESSAKPKK